MKKRFLFALSCLLLMLNSCINEEGLGGKSVIEGRIYKVYHLNDSFNFETDTFPAAKEDVYLIFGNEAIYGDKMETGYDGFFRFSYLTPGTYKVYAYSTLQNSQQIAVMDTVTVKYGKSARTKDIYIHEGKSYNTSYIKGAVKATYYNKGMAITEMKPAGDVRVFIKQKGATYHFDEIRTGLNGEFIFKNLQKGIYEVFVFTENPYTEALSPVLQTIEISSVGEIFTFSADFEIIITV